MALPINPVHNQHYKGYEYNSDEEVWVKDELRTRVFQDQNTLVLPPIAALGDTLVFVCPSDHAKSYIGPPEGVEIEILSTSGKALEAGNYPLLPGESVRLVRTGTEDVQKWTACFEFSSAAAPSEPTDSFYSLVLTQRRTSGTINLYKHGNSIYVEFKDVKWGGSPTPLLTQSVTDPAMFPKIDDPVNPQNSAAEFKISNGRGEEVPVKIFTDGKIGIYYASTTTTTADFLNGGAVYLGSGAPESTLPKKISEDVTSLNTKVNSNSTRIDTLSAGSGSSNSDVSPFFLKDQNDLGWTEAPLRSISDVRLSGSLKYMRRGGFVTLTFLNLQYESTYISAPSGYKVVRIFTLPRGYRPSEPLVPFDIDANPIDTSNPRSWAYFLHVFVSGHVSLLTDSGGPHYYSGTFTFPHAYVEGSDPAYVQP